MKHLVAIGVLKIGLDLTFSEENKSQKGSRLTISEDKNGRKDGQKPSQNPSKMTENDEGNMDDNGMSRYMDSNDEGGGIE